MPFPDPEGRIRHAMDVMHRAETGDNPPVPIPEGWLVSTDGTGLVGWIPPTEIITDADVSAIEVGAVSVPSGAGSENVQGQLDELYGALGWSLDTLGAVTDNSVSPVTIMDDATWNEFPGAIRLDAWRVLIVYRGNGTDHETDGEVCGQILTLNAAHTAISDIGDKFVILTDAEDLRLEDGVSIVDDQIVVAFRLYDGADNHDPQIMICDDPPWEFTEDSTWGTPIAMPDPGGTVQKYTQGHVQKLANGTYILPGGFDSGGNHTVGLWRWTGTVDDPSAATFVTVASGANDYAEIAIEEITPGNLIALVRSVTNTDIDKNTSADSGATWAGVAAGFDGYGYPTFRQFLSGLGLTVYRDAPNGDNAWRPITGSMGTFGSETILDTTGTRSAYATILQITPQDILVVYAIEYSSGGATGTADLFAQWFADSSTFGPSITVDLSDDTPLIESGAGDPGVSTEASRSDHVHPEFGGGSGVGPILIEDTHSTPLIFDDLLQNDAMDDLLYADI